MVSLNIVAKLLIEETTITNDNFLFYALFLVVIFTVFSFHNVSASNQMDMQNYANDNCSSNSQCNSVGTNFNLLSGNGNYGSQVNSMTHQCNSGSACSIQSQNELTIFNSQSSMIIQNSNTNNICQNSICSNRIQTDASISNADNSKIIQNGFQQNRCTSSSECYIVGSISGTVENGIDNQELTQSLSQRNYCFHNSKCYIEGSALETGGSNTQVNICLLGSDCTNTNPNSKLIAIGSICSSTSSGVTICTPHGTFSLPTSSKSESTQQNQENFKIQQLGGIYSNDNSETVNTGDQEEYLVNFPASNSIEKSTNLREDQETIAGDSSRSQVPDTSLHFGQIKEIQKSPNAYNYQKQTTHKAFNIFNEFGNNLVQKFQNNQYVSNILHIMTSQETQSISMQSHNPMINTFFRP